MKSIEDDENEANDGEALDENDFELKINEDQMHCSMLRMEKK